MGNPWTPGPWRVLHGDTIFPMDSEALSIAATTRQRPERKANARLIQHAPEMAEALECLARMAERFPAERIYGTRPRSGAIYTVADVEHGEASITVEDLHRARAILSRIRGDAP